MHLVLLLNCEISALDFEVWGRVDIPYCHMKYMVHFPFGSISSFAAVRVLTNYVNFRVKFTSNGVQESQGFQGFQGFQQQGNPRIQGIIQQTRTKSIFI